MMIGKFKVEPQYDMCCSKCGEYRSNIGWSVSLSKKPTVKDLKYEGWTFVEGYGQLCPRCSKERS